MKNRRFWCLSESLFWRLQMKKIFLLRHSIPQKGNMPNEQIPLSEKGRALAISKRNIFANVNKCFSSPYRRAMEIAESPVCGHASFFLCELGSDHSALCDIFRVVGAAGPSHHGLHFSVPERKIRNALDSGAGSCNPSTVNIK